MSKPDRSAVSDLLGAARMSADAALATTDVVEKMHRTIQLGMQPFNSSSPDRTRGITGLVYRNVRGGISLASQIIDACLAPVAKATPSVPASARRDALRSIANGVYGDYLLRTGNPLAIDMSLRAGGRQIDLQRPADVLNAFDQARPDGRKLLLMVHGLCMNDRQWHRDGHDHGAALAAEFDYLPVYLHYNSGLPIAHNGRALANILEHIAADATVSLADLTIIGHSMGGLVARSACHFADKAGHTWPRLLSKLVFLGTPHHGAPLEKAGHGLDLAMGSSAYSLPLTQISRARSAGIVDLRSGTIAQPHEAVPLPANVRCYAAAAVSAKTAGLVSRRLTGDGLVPLDSALGVHSDKTRDLGIDPDRQWVGYRMGHIELLHRPDVYAALRRWLNQG